MFCAAFQSAGKWDLQWQMSPWCKSPRRNLWHLSQRSSDWKLDSTMRWGGVRPEWQLESPSPLALAVTANNSDSLLVERWHSSSMQTRMAFWWNSSLTPIFYQTRNKTSENQNIVKIERKTPKNKAHTHSSTNGPNKEIRAQTITRKTGGHHEHTHTKKRFITSPIRLTPPAGEREKLVAANLVRKRACVYTSLSGNERK